MHPRNGGERGGGRGAAIEHRLVRLAIFPQEAGAPVELVVEPRPDRFGRPRLHPHIGAERLARIVEQRSEEHTSELQSLMRISYAVFCLKKKTKNTVTHYIRNHNIEQQSRNNI